MGAERRSAVISEENKRMTAYHEGGHAVVAIRTKGAHPIHKATIMPRGQALGMVFQASLTAIASARGGHIRVTWGVTWGVR